MLLQRIQEVITLGNRKGVGLADFLYLLHNDKNYINIKIIMFIPQYFLIIIRKKIESIVMEGELSKFNK